MNLLSGAFSNQKRAFDDPSPLYALISVRFRPAPQLAPGSLLLSRPTPPPRRSLIASVCCGRAFVRKGVW